MKYTISIAFLVGATSAINLGYINKGWPAPAGGPAIEPTSFRDNNNCLHTYDYTHSQTAKMGMDADCSDAKGKKKEQQQSLHKPEAPKEAPK